MKKIFLKLQEKVEYQKVRWGLLGFCCVFFLFWLCLDGYTIAVDTEGYESFALAREPIYPLVLAIFRKIFGKPLYYNCIAGLQCLITGYAVWKVVDVLTKQFKLDVFSSLVILGLQIIVQMLNRFFSGKKTLYCLEIRTEGIAIPLFALFFVQLFLYMVTQKKKNMIGVIVYSILLISLRKQMYVVLLIMGLAWFYMFFRKYISWKKVMLLCLCTCMCLVGSKIVDRTYNYVIRGDAIEHTKDSIGLLITCFFSADEYGAVNYDDSELKALYLEIVTQIEENNWGYKSAPTDWYGIRTAYEQYYDLIQFDIINPSIMNYVEQKGYTDYIATSQKFDETVNELLKEMLTQNLGVKVKIYMGNWICGLANTLAKSTSIFIPVALLALFAFVVCFVIQFWIPQNHDLQSLGVLTMICVMTNISIVSLLIFTQSRYMIYNMPFFYISFYLFLRKFLIQRMIIYREKGLKKQDV